MLSYKVLVQSIISLQEQIYINSAITIVFVKFNIENIYILTSSLLCFFFNTYVRVPICTILQLSSNILLLYTDCIFYWQLTVTWRKIKWDYREIQIFLKILDKTIWQHEFLLNTTYLVPSRWQCLFLFILCKLE